MKKYLDFFNLIFIFIFNLTRYNFIYLYNLINKIDNKNNRLIFIKNLSNNLLKLNVNYIKIIQALALDKDFLTIEENNYLINFTDKVPYSNKDINFKILDYLKKNNVTFDSEIPINSGISALVYKGKFNSNNIAIKILKNDAEINLYNCFNTLEIFLKIYLFFNRKSIINIKSIFYENKKIMLNQINMVNEKNNIIEFSERCKNFNYLNVPKVYNINEISNTTNYNTNYNSNFIIMDFIDGITINQLLSINNKELNYIFAKNILNFGLISIFFTNAIHYDLHPGNIIFKIVDKKTSKSLLYNDINKLNIAENFKNYNFMLGLIDFGIVFFPNSNMQDTFYSFFSKIFIEKNYKDAAQLMVNNFIRNKSNINEYVSVSIYNTIINIIEEIFQNYFGKNIEFNIDFFYIINKSLNYYNLIFTDEFSKMILSLSIPTNLTKKLIDDRSITKTTTDLINELYNIKNLISFDN